MLSQYWLLSLLPLSGGLAGSNAWSFLTLAAIPPGGVASFLFEGDAAGGLRTGPRPSIYLLISPTGERSPKSLHSSVSSCFWKNVCGAVRELSSRPPGTIVLSLSVRSGAGQLGSECLPCADGVSSLRTHWKAVGDGGSDCVRAGGEFGDAG